MARWCRSSASTPTSRTTSTSTTAPPIRWTRSIRRTSPRTLPPSPWSRTRWPRCRRRCRVRRRGRRHIRSTPGGAMQTLRSFVGGRWVEGKEPFSTLVNPSTEEPLARTSSNGIDVAEALELGRAQGGPALRELTFAQRGELLKSWSKAMHAARDELIALAMQNGGNTRGDAKFDIDGAIATLSHYAELGAQLGSLRALRDGEAVQLGRTALYAGIHLWDPIQGLVIHIYDYNYLSNGTGDKGA